jgi:large subunit ribosomal protein L3
MSTEKLFPEGLLGKKIGMTQIFTKEGESVPVTAIEVGPCFILEVKNKDKHGYSGVQLGFAPRKNQRVTKADLGHFGKAAKGAFYHVREIRCDADKLGWTTLGQELKAADVFAAGELVDVSGVTIGRGFSGVVRRYKVKGQPATRGTHEYRRHIGAVGCRKYPGRIFKNKRMPGHMGNENRTIQNIEVVGVRPEENIVLVRGGIPGAAGGLVMINKAIKGYNKKKAA